MQQIGCERQIASSSRSLFGCPKRQEHRHFLLKVRSDCGRIRHTSVCAIIQMEASLAGDFVSSHHLDSQLTFRCQGRPPASGVFTQIDMSGLVGVVTPTGYGCAVCESSQITCFGSCPLRNVCATVFLLTTIRQNWNVPPSDGWLQVCTGQSHACGLTLDGLIECWGSVRLLVLRIESPMLALCCAYRTDSIRFSQRSLHSDCVRRRQHWRIALQIVEPICCKPIDKCIQSRFPCSGDSVLRNRSNIFLSILGVSYSSLFAVIEDHTGPVCLHRTGGAPWKIGFS